MEPYSNPSGICQTPQIASPGLLVSLPEGEYEDKRDISADLRRTLCYNNEPSNIGAEGADYCANGNITNHEISAAEQQPPANVIKEETASWDGGNQSDCRINPVTEQIQETDPPTPIMGYSLNNSLALVIYQIVLKRKHLHVNGENIPIAVEIVPQNRYRECLHLLLSWTSVTVVGFLVHKKTHTGAKPFVRSECEKLFVGHSDLTVHQRSHTGKKPFACSECGNFFTDLSGLRTHKKDHRAAKPFSCSECGKGFTRRSGLTAHLRIHTGEKPFTCTECGKCFYRISHLTRHLRTHTGEKLFTCTECGKCFASTSHLNVHQKIHKGEKPFTCTECGKCFARRYLLTAHSQLHTGEKPV
ncbi:hypothetical protein XELAEV_18002324mg [Xenopus laevis]|nr:hypothetical protein XELAEV_18002324mg [Xenopus laevis]